MPYRADVVAIGPSGELVVVEAKAVRNTDDAWASRIRSHSAEQGWSRAPRYFVLATPDRFYGWTNPPADGRDVRPDWHGEAGRLLAPYSERSGIALESVRGEAWEHLVGAWLRDLVESDGPGVAQVEWLRGVQRAAAGGHVAYEAVV